MNNMCLFFIKQKTAYEMRISDWSSDVCSSDLQILDWAGPDFEGIIAFDEAHEMGGVAGGEGALGRKEGSQQGVCGVLLQNHLPGARVLYASATGASDVNNLAYAVRLGLWGPGTAFDDREQFIAGIRKGGIVLGRAHV